MVDHRFVLVLPEGQGGSWNAGGCCGLARSTGIDDVSYLRAVVEQVAARPEVDPDRIFVVGESNGGMMAVAYACADSTAVAGVATVAGTPVSGCKPQRGIPTMPYSPIESSGRQQRAFLDHPALRTVAARLGATPAQVAIAWTLRHDDAIVIPCMRPRVLGR